MASPVATPSPVMAPAARPDARLACTTTSKVGPGLRNVKANRPTVSNTVWSGSMAFLAGSGAGARRHLLGQPAPARRNRPPAAGRLGAGRLAGQAERVGPDGRPG